MAFEWRQYLRCNGNSYSLYNVQLSDAGNYSVFVTDADGGTTSSNALLQVGIAPAFTSQATAVVGRGYVPSGAQSARAV